MNRMLADDDRFGEGLACFGVGAKAAVPAVRQVIDNEHELDITRGLAIGTLARLAPDDPATKQTLRESAKQHDSWVGQAARESLEWIENQ